MRNDELGRKPSKGIILTPAISETVKKEVLGKAHAFEAAYCGSERVLSVDERCRELHRAEQMGELTK
jgi:hypothetical protein